MPEVCRQLNREAEWKCFFGPNIYPTIKSESLFPKAAELTTINTQAAVVCCGRSRSDVPGELAV